MATLTMNDVRRHVDEQMAAARRDMEDEHMQRIEFEIARYHQPGSDEFKRLRQEALDRWRQV